MQNTDAVPRTCVFERGAQLASLQRKPMLRQNKIR